MLRVLAPCSERLRPLTWRHRKSPKKHPLIGRHAAPLRLLRVLWARAGLLLVKNLELPIEFLQFFSP